MTHTQVLQICLVVASAFFFFGVIFGLLVLAYGENGLFRTRRELDAEIEQGVRLQRENEGLKRINIRLLTTLNRRRVVSLVFSVTPPTAKNNSSDAGAEKSHPDVSGHAQDGTPPFTWVCEIRGHRFAIVNSNGEVKRRCLHCGFEDGSAA